MDLDKIINIETITMLLTFFIPSYISLKLFEYIATIKFDNVRINIFSVLLSYISILASKAFFGNVEPDTIIVIYLFAVILSLLFTIIAGYIYKSKVFRQFNRNILSKSHTNIWEFAASHKDGQIFVIYTKDAYCYIGQIRIISYDDNKKVNWISLINYEKLKVTENDKKVSLIDFTNENNVIVNIREEDIKSFEVIVN